MGRELSTQIVVESEPSNSGGVMAVQLALEVLESLAKHDSVGVTELSRALGTTKARVYRHLRTLVDNGYAVQDLGSERYSAGPRLVALSRVASLTPFESVVRLARPAMMRLRDDIGHSVNLSLVYGETVSIVETLQGNALIGVVMRTHTSMPLHSTAAGKLLLADWLANGIALPDRPYERFTNHTITDTVVLRRELYKVQEQGWAGAPEETVLGVNAVSAPIRDHHGDVIAMLSIMSSIQFIPRIAPRELVDAIKCTAHEISRALIL